GRTFDKPIAPLKGTSHYTLTDKDLVNVCWVIQPTSPTTVYIASLPDDIRVIGASNDDGNKTDTRSVVATQRIRRQVPIFRMPAIRAVTTRFHRLDRYERRNCNCDERNNARRCLRQGPLSLRRTSEPRLLPIAWASRKSSTLIWIKKFERRRFALICEGPPNHRALF